MTEHETAAPRPRTSFVIPARNAAETIGETLASLLAQTDPDWEAIVVDDGSTDETAAIVERHAHADGRFRLVAGPRLGVAAARNAALPLVTGERVTFIDSDDWIAPEYLELMNAALDADAEAAVAHCNHIRVMPDGSHGPAQCNLHPGDIPFERFARTCAVAIHAVLLRREALVAAGEFDTSLMTCEDWDLWQRIARSGRPWAYVDQGLSYYRLNPGSLSQDLPQMLGDAKTVIGRGFVPDPRVPNAAPDHASGASGSTGGADEAFAYFALWCAALDCGRGGRGEVGFGALAMLAGRDLAVSAMAATLLDGFSIGARISTKEVAGQWRRLAEGMATLVDSVGQWLGDRDKACAVQYALERLALDHDGLRQPRRLTRTLGLHVDLQRPVGVRPDDDIDRLYVWLSDGTQGLAILDFGVLGPVGRGIWFDLLDGPLRDRGIGSALSDMALRQRDRRRKIRRLLFGVGTHLHSHQQQLNLIKAEARQEASPAPASGQPDSRSRGRYEQYQGDRSEFWESLFSEEDPWNYGSDYEQEKYRHQLALLPEGPIGKALELACAEGHFTAHLATRVGALVATDISLKALERAQRRCSGQGNVEFRGLDLSSDDLPPDMDLIVCSEVLYYLRDRAELQQVAARIAGSLRTGGHLVTAHAYVLADDLSRTGFDWGNPFGAQGIADALAATEGLVLEESLRTDLYRVDRWRKIAAGEQAPSPLVREAGIEAAIEPEVARQIVWGGATARRADLARDETHAAVPILMYHSIADDGPAALARWRVTPQAFRDQLRWLRSNGYHSLSPHEVAWFLAHRHPLPGRPVLITFDDGFADFAETAWPILRENDFGALVFAVTDLAGKRAEWDAEHGDPGRLMTAADIARLTAEGVFFGSHTATHRRSDGVSTRDLARELLRSRKQLEKWTGQPIEMLAAPFGQTDDRLRILAAQCGYKQLFTTEHRTAGFDDAHLNLPRLEVDGAMSLEDFARMMEASR